MSGFGFSFRRMTAILVKEFIQMGRDRLTFAMMVGIPIIQLGLFGFAINTDPKHLPTAVVMGDDSAYGRRIVAAFETSQYFRVIGYAASEEEAERLLATGRVSFVVNIPPSFSRDLVRGDRPRLLVEADASDPAAASNAVGALPGILDRVLSQELKGPLAELRATASPVELAVHRRYNPEGITQYNIVPGLIGVILTLSMIMMTALSLTREVERGTMESLLAMPVRPGEVMVGKILPYIVIGLVQVVIVLSAARFIFGVPTLGSYGALAIAILLFIAAMLSLGYTFSTLARLQMQAMQMTMFFFLPSLLLSGFMFPFRGMPTWAQMLGEAFPLTHFLRVVRGILLKGNGFAEVWPQLAALTAFLVVIAAIALRRYRRTLD